VPLTSTVEIFSHTSQRDGLMAGTTLAAVTLANATLETRPNFAMPPKPTARFPRSARLLRHADFERVYKQGRRHFSASITVFYLPRPEEESPVAATSPISGASSGVRSAPSSGLRIGFTVGRVLGGAVQRNRIKRRLREAVRMTRPPAGVAADVVINPKKSLLTTDFAALLIEVTRAFAVIEQKLSGKTYPETATNRLAESRKPKPDSRP
jgi:ribonuclease P protein component